MIFVREIQFGPTPEAWPAGKLLKLEFLKNAENVGCMTLKLVHSKSLLGTHWGWEKIDAVYLEICGLQIGLY